MSDVEEATYDFCAELLQHHGVSDATYRHALECLAEEGVVELAALVGYFITVSLVMNVAHTPAEARSEIAPLEPFPR
jgi:4-carboxymuconolactone decarboxylase